MDTPPSTHLDWVMSAMHPVVMDVLAFLLASLLTYGNSATTAQRIIKEIRFSTAEEGFCS